MKLIIWILVIWIVGSLVYGSIKEGTSWMDPFIAEYKMQFEKHPVATIVVTILVCLLLFKLLF